MEKISRKSLDNAFSYYAKREPKPGEISERLNLSLSAYSQN